MEKQYDNPMRRQIYSIEGLVEQIGKDVEKKTRTILSTPEIYSLKEILITGCGDSYCAALAAEQAFCQLTGLSVRAIPAIELSRRYPKDKLGKIPGNPLVIGISNSGRVTRVIEGIMRARRSGALTLAVTANGSSALGEEAERNIVLSMPEFEKAPGIRNYVGSLLALYLFAIRMGEVLGRYTMDAASAYRGELASWVKPFTHSLREQEEGVFRMAQRFENVTGGEVIVQGNNVASAVFIQQKMYEAIGIPCVFGDSENWFHANKFLRDFAHTLTFVYASKWDKGKGRVLEAMKRMDYMGREYILVTDDQLSSRHTLYVPSMSCEMFSPIVEFGLPCLLLSYLTELKNETYSRGFVYPFCDGKGIPGTVESRLEIVD